MNQFVSTIFAVTFAFTAFSVVSVTPDNQAKASTVAIKKN